MLQVLSKIDQGLLLFKLFDLLELLRDGQVTRTCQRVILGFDYLFNFFWSGAHILVLLNASIEQQSSVSERNLLTRLVQLDFADFAEQLDFILSEAREQLELFVVENDDSPDQDIPELDQLFLVGFQNLIEIRHVESDH